MAGHEELVTRYPEVVEELGAGADPMELFVAGRLSEGIWVDLHAVGVLEGATIAVATAQAAHRLLARGRTLDQLQAPWPCALAKVLHGPALGALAGGDAVTVLAGRLGSLPEALAMWDRQRACELHRKLRRAAALASLLERAEVLLQGEVDAEKVLALRSLTSDEAELIGATGGFEGSVEHGYSAEQSARYLRERLAGGVWQGSDRQNLRTLALVNSVRSWLGRRWRSQQSGCDLLGLQAGFAYQLQAELYLVEGWACHEVLSRYGAGARGSGGVVLGESNRLVDQQEQGG